MYALYLTLQSLVLLQVATSSGMVVVTRHGLVEGIGYSLENGKQIHAFLGVPYAKPPIGEYRFEEPKPVEKWDGTWKAESSSPPCLQLFNFFEEKITGSEDCLYLDIYTPTTSRNASLPLMVFFHGGAFTFGMGSIYHPKYLMDQTDFIFISLNYRLGPLGFLSTEDSLVPGNNGLKDQATALKWIQDNVEAFGGDKNKVTIVGHSAGGASVQLHYLSQWSKDLFRNGISVSGSALNPWALTEHPLQKARMLAVTIGCPTTPSERMVKWMKQRPGEHFFLNFSSVFIPWHKNPFTPFGPVIEIGASNPFLGEHPYQLLSEGKVQDKPYLVSMTTEEGLYPGIYFIENKKSLQELNSNWSKIAPLLLDYNYTVSSDRVDLVSAKVREFYFGEDDLNVSNTGKIINMLSDRLFKSGIAEAAVMQASAMKSPVFMYSIGYRFNISLTGGFTKTKYGVSHGDDVINMFQVPYSKGSSDKIMSQTLQKIWFSFMKSGVLSTAQKIEWNPVSDLDNYKIKYLNIESQQNMTMLEETDYGNMKFWNSLELNENHHFNNSLLHTNYNKGDKLVAMFLIVCVSVVVNIIFMNSSLLF